MSTTAQRIQRFIDRRAEVSPHSHTVWSDTTCYAVCLRLDDLRELLALAKSQPAEAEQQD